MPRKKGDSKAKKAAWIQKCVDILVKVNITDVQLVKLLRSQDESLTERTAYRYAKEARKVLAGLGSQASDQERGLLAARLEDLYSTARRQDNPDFKALNSILGTQLRLHTFHPDYRNTAHEPSHTSPTDRPALSPELKDVLKRSCLPESTNND